MPRKSDFPLKKTIVNLVEGDKEELLLYYPNGGGYNVVIRTLVHNHILKLRERASRSGAFDNANLASLTDDATAGSLGLDDGGT